MRKGEQGTGRQEVRCRLLQAVGLHAGCCVATVFQASNGLDEMQTAYTNGKDKAGFVLAVEFRS